MAWYGDSEGHADAARGVAGAAAKMEYDKRIGQSKQLLNDIDGYKKQLKTFKNTSTATVIKNNIKSAQSELKYRMKAYGVSSADLSRKEPDWSKF